MKNIYNMKEMDIEKWKRMGSIAFLVFLITHFLVLQAEGQTLTVHAPQQVSVGEQFRLQYTVSTQNARAFQVGDIPDAFEVLMGPSTSSQSSFQMVNGHTSQSSSITYTYILVANKNGTFTIPPAQINANGRTITSNAHKITVSGSSQGGAQGGQPSQQQSMRAAGSRISGSDLYIKVTPVSKHMVENLWDGRYSKPSTFIDQIDREPWYEFPLCALGEYLQQKQSWGVY